MRKIITIAESVLDTEYRHMQPVRSFVGGRIPCAAASLAQVGVHTSMVSECTTDSVGDIIMDYLEAHKVDTKSVDRYPEGTTAFSAIFRNDDGTTSIVNYGQYPEDRFKVIWPRIDKDDIVILGSLYSVDLPQRERLYELLSYAAERKAIIVYLPGFQHGINFRITRVMPHILENLELANVVIAQQQDIDTIFPGENDDEAYHNHIEFYCDTYVHITPEMQVKRYAGIKGHVATYAPAHPATGNLLGWQAGLTAGIVYMLLNKGITHDMLPALGTDAWSQIMDEALMWAAASTGNDNCIDSEFAASRTASLQQALQDYEKKKETDNL